VSDGVFVHLAVHEPRPGKEDEILESMQRFGSSATGAPGFRFHAALPDERTTRLVRMAIWDSREAWAAAIGGMREAAANVDFDALLERDPDVFLLTED